MKLRTDQIRTDGGTQMRVGPYHDDILSDYGEVITGGGQLPPVTVFHDGSDYWLADGFHRLKAHKNADVREIEAEVREGSKRDAILHAVGANTSHGLRRTNADKRRAVETLLRDEEWSRWSDREIARRAGVSHNFVNTVRPAICHPMTDSASEIPRIETRTVERGGTVYEQRHPQRQAAPAPQGEEGAAIWGNPQIEPEERQPVVDSPAEPAPQPDAEETEWVGPTSQDAKPSPPTATPPAARRPLPPIPQLPAGYRPGADPAIPARVDELRKALDRLLRFDKDGEELLEHPGSALMQLKLLAHYAHEMLGDWLHGAPSRQDAERTITVETLN